MVPIASPYGRGSRPDRRKPLRASTPQQLALLLPGITELLRADVLRVLRREAADQAESREQLERILALTPHETRDLVERLRADGWDSCDKTKRFLAALEERARTEGDVSWVATCPPASIQSHRGRHTSGTRQKRRSTFLRLSR